MDFLLYEPEDFASNESYLNYYFRLNEEDVNFWQLWISNHPEKLDCIINADQLINLLALQLDEGELMHEYQRLASAIHGTSTTIEKSSAPPEKKTWKLQLASLILMAAIGTALFLYPTNKKDLFTFDNTITQNKDLQKKINSTSEPLKLQLEDGSIITLQPGSIISYPHQFSADAREVYLEGEAFFEVSKNKKRPFYVYCKSLVAHVLGTSFNVKTDKLNGKVEVAVSTGKVEVYHQAAEDAKESNRKPEGLILTPNQKAIYVEENNHFESSLVDAPLPIHDPANNNSTDSVPLETIYSKATPLSTILKTLEKTYGIEIDTENDNIRNCHFSGDLLDMNLYFKLDAICQSVNATYEVKGTKILIRGKGCK